MPWIVKVEHRAVPGGDLITEFVASGIADEKAALDHVRLESQPEARLQTVTEISEGELLRYGVPAGRTQVIQFTGHMDDQRAVARKLNAEAFLQEWVADNAEPTSDDNVATARSLTSRCFAEATSRGIDVDELAAAAGGDLENYITHAIASPGR